MKINSFMKDHNSEIKNIILGFDGEFNSHDFIKKFMKEYELFYIEKLVDYKGKGAFRSVNSQIAKFLYLKRKPLA